ncbi:Delta(14)-sterol reductase [Smittium mucronatum]|uniref:Delta(14)-sterol reductase n=1 Tax=Smittium mucronatum TaxID=133383 RepID=A0A1R0GUC4_9FUNG|nr:Delta(14)-sterol reductase [Smittium mucronatum]
MGSKLESRKRSTEALKETSKKGLKESELNPKTLEFEFFGNDGVKFVMVSMSLVVMLLESVCNGENKCVGFSGSFSYLVDWFSAGILYLNVIGVYIGYVSWLVVLYFICPGETVKGTTLRNGDVLTYPTNGLLSAILTILVVIADVYLNGIGKMVWVADNFKHFVVTTLFASVLLSLYVYFMSFRKSSKTLLLSTSGNSGIFWYDFFMGRELNPRLFNLDIKYFCELRPGLIGWILVNLAFVAKQYQNFGEVSVSMLLVTASQIVYVLDSLVFEKALLTTMDITTEGFGFMLAMGDLCWVPSVYTLQARYLSYNNVQLSTFFSIFVGILSVVGYLVFRFSNLQKNNFRNSNNAGNEKFLETKAGSKLLISGWWGLARHINYTGDWLLGLSQCLATGFGNPLTYFFSMYFLILLLHRNYRDEIKCHNKYGKDWDRYCSIVKYRFIPYIY